MPKKKLSALEELQAFTTNTYPFRPAVQEKLKEYNINFSDSGELETGDELIDDVETDTDTDTDENALSDDEWWEQELHGLNDVSEELDARDRERQERDRLRQEEPESDEAKQQRIADATAEAQARIKNAAETVADDIKTRVNNTADTIASIPTPAGLTLPLVIGLILLLILIPINGQPRLVWLWLVITGKAKLTDEKSGLNIATAAENAFLQGLERGASGALGGAQAETATEIMSSSFVPESGFSDIISFDRYINY